MFTSFWLGKKVYRQKKITNRDNRLSKREFRDFVTACVIHMADGGETFENFVEFLSTSVQVVAITKIKSI